MKVDYLIIGQGISGTILSWEMQNAGLSFIVVDDDNPNTASRAAAGVINPITGRRMAITWMADELLPHAEFAYTRLGQQLGIVAIDKTTIIEFFPTLQMRSAFLERVAEQPDYLHFGSDDHTFSEYFNFHFGYGTIRPCYKVKLDTILTRWRKYLHDKNHLVEKRFVLDELVFHQQHVQYQDIEAKAIIFCDGVSSYSNPHFPNLPFAANKGEAIIFSCVDLPSNDIFKKNLTIVPMENGLFWIGSSYEWEFADELPSENFRKRVENVLKEWLKLPYEILEHRASLRPATLERRPFVGMHPQNPMLGIFNGMGTKGCSLAPFFAKQFVDNLLTGEPILPAADIGRFRKAMSRGK